MFAVAKRTLDNYFRDEEGGERPWLFPQLVRSRGAGWTSASCRTWDNAYLQMLLLAECSHAAAERIYRAIVMGTPGEKRLMPILRPYEAIGSTDDVCFETTKACYDTTKSHINRVALDSGWETELAQKLERCPRSWPTPRTRASTSRSRTPTRAGAAQLRAGLPHPPAGSASGGDDDLLTLVLEVSGEAKKEKQAKVAAAADLWIPAINNWGGLGRWAFLEVTAHGTPRT